MISDEQDTEEPNSRQVVAQLRFAMDRLTEAIHRALEAVAEAGAVLARLDEPAVIRIEDARAARDRRDTVQEFDQPHWRAETRTLSLGNQAVKRFRVPARNQEAILAAFEEEGWPNRIDDPLPYKAGVKAKYRLHFTIGRLNQSARRHLIRFFGDGTGEGVCWEHTHAAAESVTTNVSGERKRRRAA